MKKLVFLLVCFLGVSSVHAMEVDFERDPSLPIVYLNVAVKAGAVVDPTGKSGLTNFTGEMLLRGTRSKTKEQIDLALDQMGATLEVDVRSESLILRGAVLSSKLDAFLNLVNELVTQPSFPDSEIRKLKSEMISGILEELGQDPSLASRKFTEYLFQGHPYGKPVLGKVKDVATFTRDDVAKLYDNLFRDSLFLVVGTGDANESTISDWSKNLAKQRKGNSTFDLSSLKTPENPKSKRMEIIDKPERTQTQINFGQIGVRPTDAKYFPLYLGNHAFGGPSFSARLMAEIRVKRGWSYGATSYFRSGLKPRSWQVHLFPAEKDTPAALVQALKMVTELQQTGITQAEFDFSKESLVNSAGFMFNTPKKRAENKLLERTLDLPDGFMKSYGPEISHLNLLEVNTALSEFLKPDQLSISVLGTADRLKDSLAKATGIPVEKIEVVSYRQE